MRKSDELSGDVRPDDGGPSSSDKAALDAALAEYEKNPDAGVPWREALQRIRSADPN
jgi:hypothetical protein